MQIILSDHNCVGQAESIFFALNRLKLLEIVPMTLITFDEVGLKHDADDETVWKFCQQQGYLLLTGNRSTKDGSLSLELSVRRLIQDSSLPVLTIGRLNRVLLDPPILHSVCR